VRLKLIAQRQSLRKKPCCLLLFVATKKIRGTLKVDALMKILRLNRRTIFIIRRILPQSAAYLRFKEGSLSLTILTKEQRVLLS